MKKHLNNFVFKFGGTSVKDATRIKEIYRIIDNFKAPLSIVVSAVAGITDLLQAFIDNPSHTQIKKKIIKIHLQIAEDLDFDIKNINNYSHFISNELEKLNPDSGLEKENTVILSLGERLIAKLISQYLQIQNIDSVYCNAKNLIQTDSSWLEANVNYSVSYQLISKKINPLLRKNIIPIITGFIGSNPTGDLTLLGRNSSDFSASIVARSLNSKELWIWTDVDGLFTCDPKDSNNAQFIKEISFKEVTESYFEAKIIHPKTLIPLIDSFTIVRIKNIYKPFLSGTLIHQELVQN